ncbi:DUF927 domain-containing protein [Peribacillus acanthi]|uniref:DUF927 domain-containing protein n=1 Tax=Peribacillus acanthi TaxID=2171554 RepID=UPI000D3E82DA|nr:DUF927 domain-containing protein [Peribacillus acanthi]
MTQSSNGVVPKKRKHTQAPAKQIEYFGSNKFFKLTPNKLYIKAEGEGTPSYDPVSKYVKITKIEQAEESHDVTLTLEFLYLNQYKTIEITRDQLQPNELQKLTIKGIDVFYHNVKGIVQFLRCQEEQAPYESVHTHLGWEEHKGGLYFKHHEIIGQPTRISTYKGKFNIEPKGTLQGWKDVIEEEVVGNSHLEIALTFGFSAVIVGMLSTIKDIDSLIVHICGKSSKGKTTAAQTGVSPFGRPSKNDKGLIKSWNATGNAIVTYVRNNHGVPIVLDEASMSNLKDFTALIYTFAENREKDRMTKDGGLRNQGDWSTTIISTAEHSLFQKTNSNEGLRVRAFEFPNTTWTTSAENSNAIKEGLMENYGHAGIEFIQYVQQLGVEEVDKRCKKWMKTCEETLKDSPFISRISEKFGIILATAELVNEALNLPLDIAKMLEVLYEVELESANERDQGEKAYDYILEKIVQNHDLFRSDDREFKGRECWGKITYGDVYHEVAILRHKMKQFLTENGVTDPKVVFQNWKEKGYLKAETGKHSNRRIVMKSGEEELRKQSGLKTRAGSKGEDVVYVLHIPSKQLTDLGVRKIATIDEIKNMARPKKSKK